MRLGADVPRASSCQTSISPLKSHKAKIDWLSLLNCGPRQRDAVSPCCNCARRVACLPCVAKRPRTPSTRRSPLGATARSVRKSCGRLIQRVATALWSPPRVMGRGAGATSALAFSSMRKRSAPRATTTVLPLSEEWRMSKSFQALCARALRPSRLTDQRLTKPSRSLRKAIRAWPLASR